MKEGHKKLLKYIFALSLFAVGLGLIRYFYTNQTSYLWLNWNLFLALIPIVFAWLSTLAKRKWSSFILIIFWLGFLPNSSYIITDFIHLADVGPKSLLWLDALMIFAYSLAGVFAWILSLDVLRQHYKWRSWTIWFIAFLSGFGIYLGRYIRFNTWDVLTNPVSLLETIGDIILHPISHDPVIAMTFVFAVLLSGSYIYLMPFLTHEKTTD